MFYSVQALRFLAAMAVAQFHCWPLPSTIQLGAAGVDVFFVISGLVIGLTKPNESAYLFLIKRLIRIFPLYWIGTAITVAFPYYEWGAETLPDWNSLWTSFFLFPNTTADWHPIYFAAWTLVFELFFYISYSIVLFLTKGRFTKIICIALLLVVANTSLLGGYTGLLIEFCYGLVASKLVTRKLFMPPAASVFCIGLALLAFACFYGTIVWPALPRQIVWGIPSFFVVYGALSFENAPLFRNLFLRAGGEASYAIYLVHVTIGAIVVEYCKIINMEIEKIPFSIMIISVIITTISGFALHVLVEKPILSLLRNILLPRDSRDAQPLVATAT